MSTVGANRWGFPERDLQAQEPIATTDQGPVNFSPDRIAAYQRDCVSLSVMLLFDQVYRVKLCLSQGRQRRQKSSRRCRRTAVHMDCSVGVTRE